MNLVISIWVLVTIVSLEIDGVFGLFPSAPTQHEPAPRKNECSNLVTKAKNSGLTFLNAHFDDSSGLATDWQGPSRSSMVPMPQDRYHPDFFTNILAFDLVSDHLANITRNKLTQMLLEKVENRGSTPLISLWIFKPFSADVDDTSFLYSALFSRNLVPSHIDLPKLLQLLANNTCDAEEDSPLDFCDKGVIRTWFSPFPDELPRNSVDAAALADVLQLFYLTNTPAPKATENYVFDWFLSGKYLNGTLYYPPPDAFLFLFTRAVVEREDILQRFGPLLMNAVQARLEDTIKTKEPLPIDLALQILTYYTLKSGMDSMDMDSRNGPLPPFRSVVNPSKLETLVSACVRRLVNLQRGDGSWPVDGFYWFPNYKWVGGYRTSTWWAVAALVAVEAQEKKDGGACIESSQKY